MEKIRKEVFNSGFLSVVLMNDEEESEQTLYPEIPYGVKTVTENRFNAALASGDRIDKVIQIPLYQDLPHNAYIKLSGKYFTIWKQQLIETTCPPINVLTLKVYE